MGAIVLDASKVNSFVLPNLVKSKNTMQDAYSTSQSLRNSLPSSFAYRSTINDIVNQLYNIKREINDIDTMISKKVERAKTIENRNDNRASGIAKAASSIGSIVGTIGGAAIGARTGGVVGAAAGAYVGNKVGSEVGKALANTGAKIWNGATKVAKSIWGGIKDLGKSIWNGCKKVAKSIASFVKEAVSGLVKAAKAIWEGLKWVWNEVIVRTAASIVNFVVSLVEGLVSFVEALGDVVLLVVGAVCSIFTAISDVIEGCITGNWDWSATNAVWKKWILPWVGYDWTSKCLFDPLYNTKFGKWLDNNAYSPFKRENGFMYKVGKGVGYVVGVVVLTVVTFGAGGVAASVGTQVGSGLVAGTAALGKNTQSGYNSLTEEEKEDSMSLLKMMGNSTVQAGVEGVTFALTYGKGLKAGGSEAKNVVLKTLATNGHAEKFTKAGIQAAKAYVSDGAESLIMGKEFDFSETTQSALVNAGTSIFYDYTIGAAYGNFIKNNNVNSSGLNTDNAFAGAKQETIKNVTESIKNGSKKVLMLDEGNSSKKYVGDFVKKSIQGIVNTAIDYVEGVIA